MRPGCSVRQCARMSASPWSRQLSVERRWYARKFLSLRTSRSGILCTFGEGISWPSRSWWGPTMHSGRPEHQSEPCLVWCFAADELSMPECRVQLACTCSADQLARPRPRSGRPSWSQSGYSPTTASGLHTVGTSGGVHGRKCCWNGFLLRRSVHMCYSDQQQRRTRTRAPVGIKRMCLYSDTESYRV